MCGICAVIQSQGCALSKAVHCLTRLEYRGYDSVGIGFHDQNGTNCSLKTTSSVRSISAKLDTSLAHSSSPCIGHTRWATHGRPSLENCHPHTSFGGLVSLCHNGIIENHLELRMLLNENSIEMASETDTECIAHLLEQFIRSEMISGAETEASKLSDERVVAAISRALDIIEGSFALVFLLHGDNTRIFGARRDAPLVVGQLLQEDNSKESVVFIASDYQAFVDSTNLVTFLEDDDIVVSRNDGSYSIWHGIFANGKQGSSLLESRHVTPLPSSIPGSPPSSPEPPKEEPPLLSTSHIGSSPVQIRVVHRKQQRVTTDLGADMTADTSNGDIMFQEIMQQPAVIDLCLKNRLKMDQHGNVSVELKELTLARDRGFSGPKKNVNAVGWSPTRLVFLACGTSLHASIWAAPLFRAAGKPRIDLCIASEFQQNPHLMPELGENVTYFFVSQSGETSDTLRTLRHLKEWRNATGEGSANVRLIGVCNAVGSSISRETDVCVFTRAGPEVAVASTKAMVSQMLTLALIATQLWPTNEGKSGSFPEFLSPAQPGFKTVDGKTHCSTRALVTREFEGEWALAPTLVGLLRLKESFDDVLSSLDEQAIEVANTKWMSEAKSCFYIGRGKEFCLAQEGALKLKEISYIHAEALPCGELKHGTLALIDPVTPSIVLCCTSNPVLRNQVRSSVQEVKARGGKVIAVCLDDSFAAEMDQIVEYVVRIPNITGESMSQSIVELVFLQLLSYRVAKKLGRNVDKPRNLAKSVTVG